jgi:transcriptional regulator with GAF, ATPase, and Fis domain
MKTREELIFRTFVDVADTLVADFDVVDFLTTLASRCVELFDADEAGLMLADADGGLQVAASSSQSMNHLELFELQHNEGPCVDCYRTGQPVASESLERDHELWPTFGPEAVRAGFGSAYALPMRLRKSTIGSLNLLRVEPGAMAEADLVDAQALADVATIGLLHHRAADDATLLTGQLQYALNSRVVIEQAKGVISESGGVSLEAAFAALRAFARGHNQRLRDVARAVVEREIATSEVVAADAAPVTVQP